VADPANPPSGCYFHPRCQYAESRCTTEEPALRLVESSTEPHFAACYFADDLKLRGVIAEGQMQPDTKPPQA
jgi:peptide/nickel transport system ATP-binding protein